MALLIATARGLWRIAPRGILIGRRHALADQSIAALASMPDGGACCITDAGELRRLARGKRTWQPVASYVLGNDAFSAPTTLACDASGMMWCGVSPADLWHGTLEDDGSAITWERCEALRIHPAAADWWGPERGDMPHVSAILPVPEAAGHVLVAVAVGGIWQTTNHGQTWVTRHEGITPVLAPDARFTSAHRAVLDLTCHTTARELLARTDTALYLTKLGSDDWRWSDISPPAPEGALHWPVAAAIAHGDPQMLWAVMFGQAEQETISLWRSSDAGASWSVAIACPPALTAGSRAILLADPRRPRRIALVSEGTVWLWRGARWRRVAHGLGEIRGALWL